MTVTRTRHRRVVSLVPSITETLLEWGVEPMAGTRFCDVPGLPAVGGTKNPDVDSIVALEPDVVLMDKEENREPDARALTERGVRVVATHIRSVGDVEPALAVLARAVGVDRPPARPAVTGPEEGGGEPGRLPVVGGAAAPERPRVWVPIWRRPWMTIGAGTYGSSILEAAGFENVFGGAGEPYPGIDLDQAGRLTPHLTLAPSEPYPFSERHRLDLERVAPAVFVDGRDLFWWGARTPQALGRLRQLAAELARR